MTVINAVKNVISVFAKPVFK